MPIIPTTTQAPYDTIETVLELARTYAQDAAGPNGLAGDTLAVTVPTTLVYLNSAWQWLQDELLDSGVEMLAVEAIIAGVPVVSSVDPSISVSMDWNGFFNGVSNSSSPHLPLDMISPVKLYQRATGSGMFSLVKDCDGNLPADYQGSLHGGWEWRSDKLWLTGATQVTDLKLRYSTYYQDLTLTNPAGTFIPVIRAKRALAYRIAFEYASSRGGVDSEKLGANAQTEVEKMTNRTAGRKQHIVYRRQSRR